MNINTPESQYAGTSNINILQSNKLTIDQIYDWIQSWNMKISVNLNYHYNSAWISVDILKASKVFFNNYVPRVKRAWCTWRQLFKSSEVKNCETHNRGEWFLLFSPYCDIKYLLWSVTIYHFYHYFPLYITICHS